MALHVQSGSDTDKHNITGKKYDRCVTLESECRVTYLCHRSGPEDTVNDLTRDIHYSIRSHSVRLSTTFQANAPVMALGVCTQHQQDTTPATVIDSVPRDHTVKCTKHQQDMPIPHTGTAHCGPAFSWRRLPSHSSSSANRVISVFKARNKFWFLYLKRFAGLFRVRNIWDTRFLRVMKNCTFIVKST